MRLIPTVLAAPMLALALAGCGGDDASTDGAAGASTPEAVAAAPTTQATPEPETATGGTCRTVQEPAAKETDTPKPTGSLDASKRNLLTLTTSCGTIVIRLDAEAHPKTANAMATLARAGYYDDTVFHRVIKDFVIQGGDPTGTGTGGPSWQIVEPPSSSETYPKGTVAMAKTETDPSGTIGSQFYIVSGESAAFEPIYAVAGKVERGMGVVAAIEALADPSNGDRTTKPVVISKASFSAR